MTPRTAAAALSALVLLAALAAVAAWCYRAGAASVQARWDAAEQERERQANADRLRQFNQALAASTTHETQRAAIARNLTEARNALSYAMRSPIICPASGQLGDVVLPAGALAGVRDAAAGASATAR